MALRTLHAQAKYLYVAREVLYDYQKTSKRFEDAYQIAKRLSDEASQKLSKVIGTSYSSTEWAPEIVWPEIQKMVAYLNSTEIKRDFDFINSALANESWGHKALTAGRKILALGFIAYGAYVAIDTVGSGVAILERGLLSLEVAEAGDLLAIKWVSQLYALSAVTYFGGRQFFGDQSSFESHFKNNAVFMATLGLIYRGTRPLIKWIGSFTWGKPVTTAVRSIPGRIGLAALPMQAFTMADYRYHHGKSMSGRELFTSFLTNTLMITAVEFAEVFKTNLKTRLGEEFFLQINTGLKQKIVELFKTQMSLVRRVSEYAWRQSQPGTVALDIGLLTEIDKLWNEQIALLQELRMSPVARIPAFSARLKQISDLYTTKILSVDLQMAQAGITVRFREGAAAAFTPTEYHEVVMYKKDALSFLQQYYSKRGCLWTKIGPDTYAGRSLEKVGNGLTHENTTYFVLERGAAEDIDSSRALGNGRAKQPVFRLLETKGVVPENLGSPVISKRDTPGIATGGENLPVADENWFRGTDRNAALFPKQIADQMRGKLFKNFDQFRQTFWKLVEKDQTLSVLFQGRNLRRMKEGAAPLAEDSQWITAKKNDGAHYEIKSYELHHKTPINRGGAVYDLGNILIVTPRLHKAILNNKYHYGK